MVTLLVDPYNLFVFPSIISDEIKEISLERSKAITSRANATWRTLKFHKEPTPNIVLGDSRIAYISDAKLEEKLGGKVSNLAIPGSSIKTITDLFWIAANSVKLDNVIIQINFNRYNEAINYDLLTDIRPLINKPYSYFFNANYVKDSFAVLLNSLRKEKKTRFLSEDTNLWNYPEKWIMDDFRDYGYQYPEDYFNELKEISEYCAINNIDLLFVISPNYYLVHQYIIKHNYEADYQRFKADLKLLGTTIDLDCELPISYNKEMYNDYFHFKPYLADTLISLIYP